MLVTGQEVDMEVGSMGGSVFTSIAFVNFLGSRNSFVASKNMVIQFFLGWRLVRTAGLWTLMTSLFLLAGCVLLARIQHHEPHLCSDNSMLTLMMTVQIEESAE